MLQRPGQHGQKYASVRTYLNKSSHQGCGNKHLRGKVTRWGRGVHILQQDWNIGRAGASAVVADGGPDKTKITLQRPGEPRST